MGKRKFAIPSLAAAGFLSGNGAAGQPLPVLDSRIQNIDLETLPLLGKQAALTHTYNLAAHRSHSSHRSHGSHRSHRSSSSPSYSPPPSRNSNSTPPSSTLPGTSSAGARNLPGNSSKFQKIAMQVQTALYVQDYYTGAIDGIVGPETRTAISSYQRANSMTITGTITAELLDALGIQAE